MHEQVDRIATQPQFSRQAQLANFSQNAGPKCFALGRSGYDKSDLPNVIVWYQRMSEFRVLKRSRKP